MFAHEPCPLDIGPARCAAYRLRRHRPVRRLALLAQLPHVAQDDHLVRMFDAREIVQGGHHRCQVGIVGVDDQLVAGRAAVLRATQARVVARQGVVDVRRSDAEMQADRHGGQHIIYIIVADELCRHLMIVAVVTAPTEAQHRFARHDSAPADPFGLRFGVVTVDEAPFVRQV